MGGDEYTAKMDQQLPEATILLFRRLAHAKVCCTTCSAIVVLHRQYFCVGAIKHATLHTIHHRCHSMFNRTWQQVTYQALILQRKQSRIAWAVCQSAHDTQLRSSLPAS